VVCFGLLALSLVNGLDIPQKKVLAWIEPAIPDVAPPQIEWGTDATHIEVQLTYPSLGWIAFGLSENGGMDKSDILFGYVTNVAAGDTPVVVVQDRYLTAVETGITLARDTVQNWEPVSGSQSATHTTIRARRLLKTTDTTQDREFVAGELNVIFSTNTADPTTPDTDAIDKHTYKGKDKITFVNPPPTPTPEPSSSDFVRHSVSLVLALTVVSTILLF